MKSRTVAVAFVALFGIAWRVDTAMAQTRPDKIRIGYAARAVAHSVPFVAKEAGFFAEEGIDAEIIRTAGPIAPMALVANEVDIAIMSAYLMIPVAVAKQRHRDARRLFALRFDGVRRSAGHERARRT